ncbi:MAG: tetratricopeptide repeat protein [Planctomycetes bacterium]|nr:tetratricopeptide repeat protein [Planctomycetota bacterium]MCW8136166.1 tetratricopeptide repeat protein [Planctomycetota bacterium]
MSPNLQRALLLMEQGRHHLALAEFRNALAEEPDNGFIHSSMAVCLSVAGELDQAELEARQGIALAPDLDFAHYALAVVLRTRNRLAEAIEALNAAIGLDPDDPDYWSLLALLHCQLERWQPALEAAERGLEIDGEHVECLNARALALRMLGRTDNARQVIAGALARDPEDPFTHLNAGYAALDGGDRKAAMHHFREALRIDPSMESAREGVVAALKAANPLYYLPLRFSFWLEKKGKRWGVILPIALLIGVQVFTRLGDEVPALEPFMEPVIYSYVGFVLLTWNATHLLDFLLILHPVGRHALLPRRKWGAVVLAGLTATGVAGILWFLADRDGWGIIGLVFGAQLVFLTLPVAGFVRAQQGWPRKLHGAVTGTCVAIVLLTVVMAFAAPGPTWFTLWTGSLIACGVATWVGIVSARARPTR